MRNWVRSWGFTPLEAFGVVAILMVSILAGAFAAHSANSGNNSVADEVVATAEVSTGAIQGSEETLAKYSYKGVEYRFLATGGPYFADDTFPVKVTAEGQVAELTSGFEIGVFAVMIGLAAGLLGTVVMMFISVLLDPY